MKITQVDIVKLRAWNATNMFLNLGNTTTGVITNYHYIRLLYVNDQRPDGAVRLVNGQTLLPLGFTVATAKPLYIQGDYNVSTNGTPMNLGSSNTSATFPAAVVADAITILSTSWSDANSTLAVGSRVAGPTTVNAAFLAGIVPTTSSRYSGGVENFPRFLETWSGKTFTYNGSMVVLFQSVWATAPWGSADVYSPPARNWAFDQNFRDQNKLPPGTPCARAMSRGRWAMIKPRTTG
jgi:hypothetical protein